MTLIVLFLGAALVVSLEISQVFLRLDTQAFLQLSNTTTMRNANMNAALGTVVGNVERAASALVDELGAASLQFDCLPEELYLNDAAFEAAALLSGEAAVALLEGDFVTGAFVVFNGSNVEKTDGNAHSAVYIRNSEPEGTPWGGADYILEIGPAAVARQLQVPGSIYWDIDMRFDPTDPARYRFYTEPIWASAQDGKAELLRYGYWMTPTDILRDNHEVVSYSLPLLDKNGTAFGVLGVELEVSYFAAQLMPNEELLYPNSFYAVTGWEGNTLDLDWSIAGGPLAQVYLQASRDIALSPVTVAGQDIYALGISGVGEMYGAIRPLVLYSANSPFAEENWSLIGLVPSQMLHSGSDEIQGRLLASIGVTTVVALLAVVFLAYVATRKISGLSKYVGTLSPYDDIRFARTGLREIDDLSSAVEMLSQSVSKALKTTSKILEMTLLPIGGYEVAEDSRQVVLTEYIYRLFQMEPGTPVDKQRWEEMLGILKAEPDGEFENVYRYHDQTLQKTLWLRIVESQMDGGKVGVIVDESKAIEEQRRLARELDYDHLTQLYNRNAFKREVNRAIRAKPEKMGVMIFADLDNLKEVNDGFGHESGDRLIIRAAEIFRKLADYGGIVSRISGDEFAIYLHGYDDPERVRAIVYEHLKTSDAHRIVAPDGKQERVQFSAGLAWYPKDSDNETDLLKLSDYAMYEAKSWKKGSIHEFDLESYDKRMRNI